MFKGNEDYNEYNGGTDDTVIGASIKIEGDLVSNGSIVVEGEVKGSVKTEQTLKIGEKAKVTANVEAKEAFVSGRIDGNVKVSGTLELSSSAQINGDIEVGTLIILGGAVFNGSCNMTEAPKSQTQNNDVVDEEDEG